MKKLIPVHNIKDVQNPRFTPPSQTKPTLRWFARLPESPFGDDWWPVFHDGEWHWLKSPPLILFPGLLKDC